MEGWREGGATQPRDRHRETRQAVILLHAVRVTLQLDPFRSTRKCAHCQQPDSPRSHSTYTCVASFAALLAAA